jgi:hypothetical protein
MSQFLIFRNRLYKYFSFTIKKSFYLSYIEFLIHRFFVSNEKTNYNIEEIYQLSNKPRISYNFLIKDNNIYGHGEIIKCFLKINKNSFFNNLIIEHGLVFADFVQPHILKSFANKIFTFSDYRRDIILKYTNKNVICIGPYIAYAESLLNESELQNLKNKWGNCLLVFPTHSIPDLKVSFNKNLFCDEIDKIGINYDNVIICLYWKDVLSGESKFYLNRGYKVVTAGNMYDVNFLNRLKSIIFLSSYTMSNSIGTHVGYSLYLGKPFYLFNQDYKLESNKLNNEFMQYENLQKSSSTILVKQEFVRLFSKEEKKITKEQFKFADYIFGFSQVKSKEELKKILNS